MMKFNERGSIAPDILTTFLKREKSNFLVLRSNFKINKKGIMNMVIGFMIILIPIRRLEIKSHFILLYLSKRKSDNKTKKVIYKLI
ncbi:unnamed protein product [marine sediment metagenome]|uniref:Uncharacterized protein n=1 Tax=marine sediment metagenome TaxID=412755 RepID=X1BF00_9ZZZZ